MLVEMRQTVGEVGDKADAADRFERAFFLQLLTNQDRIDLAAALKDCGHRHEDAAMRRHVESLPAAAARLPG